MYCAELKEEDPLLNRLRRGEMYEEIDQQSLVTRKFEK